VKSCPVGPRFLSAPLLRKLERAAAVKGVSAVARSPRGFLTAMKHGDLDPWWCARRAAFVKRHMAQVTKRREPLWKNGAPTRRHLALAMWAYSPTPKRLAAWARGRASHRLSYGHSFLGPRPDQPHMFDCLTCDGALFSGQGLYWRDAPDKPFRPYRGSDRCPHTRDRTAEARQKMVDDFKRGVHKGPWVNGPPPWESAP